MLLIACGDAPNPDPTKTAQKKVAPSQLRESIALKKWQFYQYPSLEAADQLIYDERPVVETFKDDISADSKPTEAEQIEASTKVLKPWILPTANRFIANPNDKHIRPKGNPGEEFPFVQVNFDDSRWQQVSVPHDWAITGPFNQSGEGVGGGMGRLPSPGVVWYRKTFAVSPSDLDKSLFLDIDGAMSYAMVWVNGKLAGGWPYGYASWRVDMSPYVEVGKHNTIAIRLDNPASSSRWYPGGGLYRNVWLVKAPKVHVGQWGTYVTTPEVSTKSALVKLAVTVDNSLTQAMEVQLVSKIYELNSDGQINSDVISTLSSQSQIIEAGKSLIFNYSTNIQNPKLWGPKPQQTPNLYLAITEVINNNQVVDRYETQFGIRNIEFDPNQGVFINGEHIHLQGVNQHHDLGALGAAFNVRAAQRQLEILRDMGVNAIRMAHNPPARELLQLTDKMGFLVVDEIFDVWERKKTPLDFHLIFPEWSEPDLRAFIRRDRNHPSVIMWSIGNEVGEQYTAEEGAKVAERLQAITKQEDPTRPTATGMNYAKSHMDLPPVMDTISLNYQGEGIRNAPAYKHLKGINTPPAYPSFHKQFPDKMIFSSENAAAVSSRSEYLFPVTKEVSAPVADGLGGDPVNAHVSSYELYTTPFGSSADKVLGSLAKHPYVAGGFIWSGFDYLGEPTPYYSARSSYFGVVDLAGFKKDRFYLYQAAWRPDYPMVHILPHWNWSDRVGKVTPVHIFTSGDEVELFLNGESLGRKKKQAFQYRLRWDDIEYQPGELKAVAYKDGAVWADETIKTTGTVKQLNITADRVELSADGEDLSFITVQLQDEKGNFVATADNAITFTLEGVGKLIATDNGDPTDFTSFQSETRKAFNGLVLAIVKTKTNQPGAIKVTATAQGLESVTVALKAN